MPPGKRKMYEDYHKGLVARYMHKIFDEIIAIGDLNNIKIDDFILDFGGGYGHFATRLKLYKNVVIYDVEPKLSQVKDYSKLTPHTIVVCHVLEHITKEEIENIIKNFKNMKPKQIIIALPTENIFSKMGVFITKLKSTYEDIPHLTTYNEVNEIAEKYLTLKERKKIVLGMTELSSYTL